MKYPLLAQLCRGVLASAASLNPNRILSSWATLVAALLMVVRASATEPTGPTAPSSAEPTHSPWQTSRHTPFASAATDVGFIYFRPRLTLGYGAPFWSFVGVDAHWLTTNSFSQPYLGWRASLPFLDVQMGARSVYPFNRRLLPKAKSHRGADLAIGPTDERSVYQAVDLEVTLLAPLLGGFVFAHAHPLYTNAPTDMHLYEEVVRAVIQPPFVLGTRGGYVYSIGNGGPVQAGAMGEVVVLPGRDSNVVRAGPLVLASFSKSLEGLATFSFVVSSPDKLGLEHGTYAFLGVLHRMATRL